ncbi:MAG: SPOR domain-containing protein [Oligoflexia bacterium]|nr:SPOR domain-containing protein [Oligoflexia bacterium]
MDEKNKVFVFDKKEVALVFIFMILSAITSFAIGVKVGKSFSFQKSGIMPQDQHTVQLKSVAEERMEQIAKDAAQHSNVANKQQSVDKTYLRLEEEFQKINHQLIEGAQSSKEGKDNESKDNEDKGTFHSSEAVTNTITATPPSVLTAPDTHASADALAAPAPARSPSDVTIITPKVPANGKYTIQLGSYQQESDAIKFADGFRIRGYTPILSEVRIPSKGIWYRVSLGSFPTISEAKQYIEKEESLFQGQDYVITEFN